MRISDWSSDVCSSDLAITDERILRHLQVESIINTRCQQHSTTFKNFFNCGFLALMSHCLPVRERGFNEVSMYNSYQVVRSEERRVGKECVSTGICRW